MSHDTPTLEAQKREQLGSKYAVRIRKQGLLPAVVYGHKQGPTHVTVDAGAFQDVLESGAMLVMLDVKDGETESCLLKDLQYDYLGTTIIHADFARVDLNEEVHVNISIELTGTDSCVGLKEAGAYLDQILTDIEVVCKATDIPDHLTLDISELQAEESLQSSDIQLPDGVKFASDEDHAIVAIHIKAEIEEDDDDESLEGSAEPEVISEKKDEGEGGDDD